MSTEHVRSSDFIGVKPGATYDEINKAYKKRRRLLHPDKAKQSFIASQTAPKARAKSGKQTQKNAGAGASKGPSEADTRRAVKQANERFARLSVVAKILLGPDKERYDQFLNNGFPKWRGTGYYYARYRPGAGSVLLGLFLVGGGAAHYGALYLSWRRQRDFVGRYIRHARRAAWGDELGIRGVPALGESATSSALPEDRNEGAAQAPNRRQRRLQERKEGKKAAKATNDANAPPPTETARPGPTGNRKRVVAENGKVLVVDSVGNVYLEEENEDGEVEEYLLDVRLAARPPSLPRRCRLTCALFAGRRDSEADHQADSRLPAADLGLLEDYWLSCRGLEVQPEDGRRRVEGRSRHRQQQQQ